MAVSSSKTSANRMAKIKAIFSCMPKPHPLRQAVSSCQRLVNINAFGNIGIVHLALQDLESFKVCALLGRCNSSLELRDTAIGCNWPHGSSESTLHNQICVCPQVLGRKTSNMLYHVPSLEARSVHWKRFPGKFCPSNQTAKYSEDQTLNQT